MATRVVRDGMLSSERIDQLSMAAELFYRRLMQVADDHGRYFANPKLLRSAAFPLRTDSVRLEDIEEWLAECERASLIRRYSVTNTTYLEIFDFGQRVQSKSKFPDPPESTVDHGESPESTALGGVVVGVEVVGESAPRTRRRKATEQTLPGWVVALEGADAVPADDPLFEWARATGIPRDWIALAWWAFEARYAESDKTYADWRAVFRRAVREDWLKLWRQGRDGAWELTTAGIALQREVAA